MKIILGDLCSKFLMFVKIYVCLFFMFYRDSMSLTKKPTKRSGPNARSNSEHAKEVCPSNLTKIKKSIVKC